jgi:signal transduction histidine kinase
VAKLAAGSGTLRISTPIGEDASCSGCHSTAEPHLGMLLVDVSIIDAQKHLIDGLRVDLAVAAAGAVLVTMGLSWLIHRLVVRRVEALRQPLMEFAAGDFAPRLPAPADPADELDELGLVFNQMADQLQQQARKQEERAHLRERAIVEERERIARELHDGMAQLLAYVNTKVMAVRLMLRKGQLDSANRNLMQLETAARELFVDVRQAVLGLRTASQIGDGLTAMVNDFATQFSQLSDVEVEVVIAPGVAQLDLSAESELQLLRIIQEALTNVRKHASATGAQVNLQVTDSTLQLMVSDDGVGFETERVQSEPNQRFGLSTMRERAEAIGARFDLRSEPGSGTQVSLQLPIGES